MNNKSQFMIIDFEILLCHITIFIISYAKLDALIETLTYLYYTIFVKLSIIMSIKL